MTKKCDFNEAKRKTSFAEEDIPLGGFSGTKRLFEIAKESNTEAVEYIEVAIKQYRENEQTESYSKWLNLLCEASFSRGLAEGLLEMKEKTYKNRCRSFDELESVVGEFKVAYADIAREPTSPGNHLKLGNGFGRLGLAKEGKNMLENGAYWNNIKDYLAKK